MNPLSSYARPASLLLLSVLMLQAPFEVNAQRRRTQTRRPAASAPAPAASPTPAATAAAQRQDVERPFDTSVAADSYVVYVEVRGLGRLASARDVRGALDAFRLIGGAPPQVNDVIDFLTANEESLSEVRVVAGVMPARTGLPDAVTALQFPTLEAARTFEPKLRALLENVGDTPGQTNASPASSTGAAPTPRGRGSSRRARQAKKTPALVMKRAGSWIYLAPEEFTFKRLKGDGTHLVADNARLQSFRGRLSSEWVFVYYETALWRRGWQVQQEEALKRQEAASIADPTAADPTTTLGSVTDAPPLEAESERPIPYGDPANTPPPVEVVSAVTVAEMPSPEASPSPEDEAEETAEPGFTEEEAARLEAENTRLEAARAESVAKQSAEERAARAMMGTLLNGIFGGITREPEAAALGLALEGDVLVARLLVSRDAGAPNNIIPFFPNVVSGPAVAPESFAVAPADSEVFVTASFDWPRIYDSLIDTMNQTSRRQPGDPSLGNEGRGDVLREASAEDDPDAAPRPASVEKGVEAMEKFFGFRLKEDLLPALGSEVALSLPVDWFEGRRTLITELEEEPAAAGEPKAAPGPVAIISLRDPDMMRRAMPLALAALGVGAPQQAAPPERRKGFEVHNLGGLAYAFVNNFLVVGESATAVRHVIDSYDSGQTLSSSTRFRDSVAWQEHQRLAFGYVSEAIMTKWVESIRKTAEGSTDPVTLAALAQLDVPPLAASYAATDKGDALQHELRLPVGLARIFAASTVISIKEGPVIGNEAYAGYALNRIHSAQSAFKAGKGNGRYGTLEELYAAKLLDKNDVNSNDAYAVELRVSGDKFTATATPKNYGTGGRRSFFIDETGHLRAANHKGEPATADDPLADHL